MKTADYLKLLKDEIHSTVFATVDEKGLPAARVIDIMLVDNDSLYFITAKGKEFYRQLTERKFAAISGMTAGEGSLSRKAVSVCGKVRCIGKERLAEVFAVNSYMAEIYPSVESRQALEVFQMYEGKGDFFDLSTKPITRAVFYLGEKRGSGIGEKGFYITQNCRGCGKCYDVCPQKCIECMDGRMVILQENCLHCGNYRALCPFGAVEKRECYGTEF